ncbi:MAG: YjdF family protein [Fretibacterium sp.]|nr:YjdF family protein [Fretibacterium sp.]
MDGTGGKLTVFFEDPFRVGVFEQTEGGKLSVCKVTFGAEPKDCEVWKFVLRHYDDLKFSPAVEAETRPAAGNPKRRQRDAGKEMQDSGIGTKSQRALQLQHEEMKAERRQNGKERREAEARRLFELRQRKRKEKRRGH